MFLRRDVGPKVPRTNANLLANVVDTKDSPARVRASNHERTLTPVKGLVDDCADEGLPLAFDGRDVNLVSRDEVVDEGRGADCAGDDNGLGGVGVGVARAWEGLFIRGAVLRVLVFIGLGFIEQGGNGGGRMDCAKAEVVHPFRPCKWAATNTRPPRPGALSVRTTPKASRGNPENQNKKNARKHHLQPCYR